MTDDITDDILVDRSDRVMTITFNRPRQKNALTHAMYATLADSLEEADKDDTVRAILFTGAGDAFTAGNDLKDFMQPFPDGKPPVWRFLENILHAEKPIVSAVNGPAIGVGLTMLLHGDLSFASTAASFKAPFTLLGLVPEAASSLLLPRSIGTALANDILMASRELTAEEALAAGLVSRIYAPGELLAESRKAAETMANFAPTAMRETKRLIRGEKKEIAARMQEEAEIFNAQLRSPEFMESAAAFMQKRAPKFA